MKVSCSDTQLNELVLLFLGGAVILFPFMLILVSYIRIASAILEGPSAQGRCKASSTCGSHLAVVALFFGTVIRAYLCPLSSSSNSVEEDRAAAVTYTVVTPLLNPFIYSLWNRTWIGPQGGSSGAKLPSHGHSDFCRDSAGLLHPLQGELHRNFYLRFLIHESHMGFFAPHSRVPL